MLGKRATTGSSAFPLFAVLVAKHYVALAIRIPMSPRGGPLSGAVYRTSFLSTSKRTPGPDDATRPAGTGTGSQTTGATIDYEHKTALVLKRHGRIKLSAAAASTSGAGGLALTGVSRLSSPFASRRLQKDEESRQRETTPAAGRVSLLQRKGRAHRESIEGRTSDQEAASAEHPGSGSGILRGPDHGHGHEVEEPAHGSSGGAEKNTDCVGSWKPIPWSGHEDASGSHKAAAASMVELDHRDPRAAAAADERLDVPPLAEDQSRDGILPSGPGGEPEPPPPAAASATGTAGSWILRSRSFLSSESGAHLVEKISTKNDPDVEYCHEGKMHVKYVIRVASTGSGEACAEKNNTIQRISPCQDYNERDCEAFWRRAGDADCVEGKQEEEYLVIAENEPGGAACEGAHHAHRRGPCGGKCLGGWQFANEAREDEDEGDDVCRDGMQWLKYQVVRPADAGGEECEAEHGTSKIQSCAGENRKRDCLGAWEHVDKHCPPDGERLLMFVTLQPAHGGGKECEAKHGARRHVPCKDSKTAVASRTPAPGAAKTQTTTPSSSKKKGGGEDDHDKGSINMSHHCCYILIGCLVLAWICVVGACCAMNTDTLTDVGSAAAINGGADDRPWQTALQSYEFVDSSEETTQQQPTQQQEQPVPAGAAEKPGKPQKDGKTKPEETGGPKSNASSQNPASSNRGSARSSSTIPSASQGSPSGDVNKGSDSESSHHDQLTQGQQGLFHAAGSTSSKRHPSQGSNRSASGLGSSRNPSSQRGAATKSRGTKRKERKGKAKH